jgi:NAD-dependent DNA ligase
MDLSTAPDIVRRFAGVEEVRAVTILLRHRFNYYVQGQPLISDFDYDCLEWYFRYLYPRNKIINGVGSSSESDYPYFVQSGRRPVDHEREYYHPKFLIQI